MMRTEVENIADEIYEGWEVTTDAEKSNNFAMWWNGYIACLISIHQINHEEEAYLLNIVNQLAY